VSEIDSFIQEDKDSISDSLFHQGITQELA